MSESSSMPPPKDPVFRDQPELRIRTRIREFLDERGWMTDVTHGNEYMSGFPDLHCYHPDHGLRWVDAKNPKSYAYTPAQIWLWPKWESYGCGVWIMFEGDQENFEKLFDPPNFRTYWRPRYDLIRRKAADILKDEFGIPDEKFEEEMRQWDSQADTS